MRPTRGCLIRLDSLFRSYRSGSSSGRAIRCEEKLAGRSLPHLSRVAGRTACRSAALLAGVPPHGRIRTSVRTDGCGASLAPRFVRGAHFVPPPSIAGKAGAAFFDGWAPTVRSLSPDSPLDLRSAELRAAGGVSRSAHPVRPRYRLRTRRTVDWVVWRMKTFGPIWAYLRKSGSV